MVVGLGPAITSEPEYINSIRLGCNKTGNVRITWLTMRRVRVAIVLVVKR